MRRVRCYECGKGYDYDEDGFCPRCGSFNLPQKASSVGADGTVIRREGINERNHKGSFVHAELHEENRERRGTLLEQSIGRAVPVAAAWKNAAKKPISIVMGIIFGIAALNIFSSLLLLFL